MCSAVLLSDSPVTIVRERRKCSAKKYLVCNSTWRCIILYYAAILNVQSDASELNNPSERAPRLFDKKMVFILLRRSIALYNVILCFVKHSGQMFRSMTSERERRMTEFRKCSVANAIRNEYLLPSIARWYYSRMFLDLRWGNKKFFFELLFK